MPLLTSAGWPWARDLPLPVFEFSPVKLGWGTEQSMLLVWGRWARRKGQWTKVER